MGYKKKALSAVLFGAIRLLSLWYGIAGLRQCALQQAASHRSAFSYWMAQPDSFWLTEAVWFLLAWIHIRASFSGAAVLWRRSPAVRARKKAAAARDAQARLRRVEAGEGPDPLWVRFPVSAEAVPGAELLAYLENVFMPFWMPLNREARTAYLRRNPPPNREWQNTMSHLSNAFVANLRLEYLPHHWMVCRRIDLPPD